MRTLRVFIAGCIVAAALWAADATGKWSASMQAPNGNSMTITMKLKQDGGSLTGTVSGRNGETQISDGKVDGNNLSFAVVREFNGNQMRIMYKGTLDGDTIHFTVMREGSEGQGRQFDAKREGSGM